MRSVSMLSPNSQALPDRLNCNHIPHSPIWGRQRYRLGSAIAPSMAEAATVAGDAR